MKRAFLVVAVLIGCTATAQIRLGLATSFSLLRNLTTKQKFWAGGQNVQVNLHFSRRETGYASIEYYSIGKFHNSFAATAKSATTSPQTIPFTANGQMRFRQVSLGWKHYFKGSVSAENGINLYGIAGFGYLFARVNNAASLPFDTSNYTTPVQFGQGVVKRLSFDVGLGAEMHLHGPVYPFVTLRTWLPASHHPSPYLHNSDRVPLSVMGSVGIRVLFGTDY